MSTRDFKGRYASFLLRIWCETETGESVWRASLEDPVRGRRIGFPNLEALFKYLKQAADEGFQPVISSESKKSGG